MENPALQYRKKLIELTLLRSCTAMPVIIEITTELDRLWDQMTIAEQEEIEVWSSGMGLQAKENLGLIDVVVNPGDTHLPRMEKV